MPKNDGPRALGLEGDTILTTARALLPVSSPRPINCFEALAARHDGYRQIPGKRESASAGLGKRSAVVVWRLRDLPMTSSASAAAGANRTVVYLTYGASNTTVPPPGWEDMSPEEKLNYIQALWDRFSEHPEEVPVPDWHRQVIRGDQRAAHRRGEITSRGAGIQTNFSPAFALLAECGASMFRPRPRLRSLRPRASIRTRAHWPWRTFETQVNTVFARLVDNPFRFRPVIRSDSPSDRSRFSVHRVFHIGRRSNGARRISHASAPGHRERTELRYRVNGLVAKSPSRNAELPGIPNSFGVKHAARSAPGVRGGLRR